MSEEMHTPGPWFIDQANNCDVQSVVDGRVQEIAATHPSVLRGGYCDPASAKANARLIAAAPDLLAAAKGLQLVLKLAAIKYGFDLEGSAAFEAAEQAIAKATPSAGEGGEG